MGNLRSLGGRGEPPVNPPFGETTLAPAAPPPAAAEPRRPAVVAVDDDVGRGEAGMPPTPQRDPEGRPLPVRVPYARGDADPEVVSAPPTRAAPRPARSPFWAAVRSHLWLGVIIVVLVGAAGTAYWGLRVHQRISEAAIERDVGAREHPAAVRCVEQQSNGAVWACGLVYQASSRCLIANVNPVGDWNTNESIGPCDHQPRLTAILPDRITASAVAADMESQAVLAGARCAKVPDTRVRWACLGPSPAANDCRLVRVAPWRSLAADPSNVCDHLPAFKKHHGKA
jgi:hypothetical protein